MQGVKTIITLLGDFTTHYFAPELEELIEAANRVRDGKSGKTPALVVLKQKTANA